MSYDEEIHLFNLFNLDETSIGLIEICTTTSLSSNSNDQKCFIPHRIRSVWIISFGLAIGAIGLLTLTVLLLIASQYSRATTIEYGRLTGFIASMYLYYKIKKRIIVY